MLKCMEWNHDLALRNHVLAMDIMDLFSKSTFSQKSRFAIVLSNSPLSLPSTGCSLKFLINKRSRFDAQNLVLVMIDCLMNQNSYALDSETWKKKKLLQTMHFSFAWKCFLCLQT